MNTVRSRFHPGRYVGAVALLLAGTASGFAILAYAPAQSGVPSSSDALAELLGRARAASGVESFAQLGQDLLIEGEATISGETGRYTARFGSDGRFVRTFDASVSGRDGFDGKETWSVDPSGMPAVTSCEERENSLLDHGVLSGRWALPAGPVVAVRTIEAAVGATAGGAAGADSPEEQRALLLRTRDGVQEVTLQLDSKSSLPSRVTFDSQRGHEVWSYADWKVVGGLAVPHSITVDDEGRLNQWHVESARLVAPAAATVFTRPATRPADTKFDPAVPARLQGRLARTGHLLVKAQVNGKDMGWFVFDSGAGSYCIDPGLADELALPAFGEMWVGGAGTARSVSHLRQAEEFTLGPATIRRPLFLELDMKQLSAGLGVELAGICGFEVLMRSVAVVDMQAGTVELSDPATFAREGITWRPLTLHGRHPHVPCTFSNEGVEEGLFRLDTGAASITVVFHSPIVKTLGLLEGRETTPFYGFAGVGGQSVVRQGRLDWFELGGLTIDQPNALFAQDEKGAMADPWTYGTIGGLFLRRFDLVFDYPHGRVGFVARE